ncbi:MAG TPA: hypothetical protein VJ960_04495 [Oceanipulchritudo sp.]|nr:hypothetical protein [Oceanipulchritudo sp.]
MVMCLIQTRSLLFGFLFALAWGGLGASEPAGWTLEEVLSRVEAANGGMEAIEAVTNIRVMGEVETNGVTHEFLLLKKRPDKIRIRLMMKGRVIETGFDGETAWRRLRDNGQERVLPISKEELASAGLDLDFDGPLIGQPLPGTQLSLRGIERIGRGDYFVVVVEKENSISRHYLDARTFRELRTVSQRIEDGEPGKEFMNEYFEYKRYGTIWFAERVEREMADGGREIIRVRQVELDPGVLDRSFAMPASAAGK